MQSPPTRECGTSDLQAKLEVGVVPFEETPPARWRQVIDRMK